MSQREQKIWSIELGGPDRGRFLVRLLNSDESRDCFLTGTEFELHLHLCDALLCSNSAKTDLLQAFGCVQKSAVWTTVKRLRKSLMDHQKDLVVHDKSTFYHLNVRSISYDYGFLQCRSCFDQPIVTMIDRIMTAIDRLHRESA